MDPLHPITPISRNIPPVTPAPSVRRTSRDANRGSDGQTPGGKGGQSDPEADELWDDQPPDDDDRPHIDVTA